jgi:hypothetical protein
MAMTGNLSNLATPDMQRSATDALDAAFTGGVVNSGFWPEEIESVTGIDRIARNACACKRSGPNDAGWTTRLVSHECNVVMAQGIRPKIEQERLGHADTGITLNQCSYVTPDTPQFAHDTLVAVFKGVVGEQHSR